MTFSSPDLLPQNSLFLSLYQMDNVLFSISKHYFHEIYTLGKLALVTLILQFEANSHLSRPGRERSIGHCDPHHSSGGGEICWNLLVIHDSSLVSFHSRTCACPEILRLNHTYGRLGKGALQAAIYIDARDLLSALSQIQEYLLLRSSQRSVQRSRRI